MKDKYVIDIQLEPENALTLKSLARPGGSAISMGKLR